MRVWQGEYVHGVREGKGKLTKADGTVIEGVWKALAMWFGVEDDERLAALLPNLGRFGDDYLLTKDQLFRTAAVA